jgi:transposase
MVNAMLWVLKTGAPWRDLPRDYGPWLSVYTRFRRWSAKGVWAGVLDALAADASETWYIDATIVRAHQDSSGAAKKTAPRRSAVHAVGRAPRFTRASTPVATRGNCT